MLCVDGIEEKVGGSYKNYAEAVKAVEIVIGFLIAGEVDPLEIVVMSAYSAQVQFVKGLLLSQTISVNESKQSLPGWVVFSTKKVRCTTVDSFQGSECDLVTTSMCRSFRPGHTEDIL